jgi:hypothetical protein
MELYIGAIVRSTKAIAKARRVKSFQQFLLLFNSLRFAGKVAILGKLQDG